MSTSKTRILTSEISVYDLPETVERVCRLARDGGKHYVCISNVHTVVEGMRDPSFAAITNGASLATADGVPLIWASRLLGGPAIHGRASGPDVMDAILDHPEGKGLAHFFYGSSAEVLEALERNLRNRGARIAGMFSPPVRPTRAPDAALDDAELEDCRRIDEAAPDIVWVGLGAPKQEIWMKRARQHLRAPVLIGVGAAFDFHAGSKSRAPRWMRENGLEWLYRLLQEPRRLSVRYLSTNPSFVAAVARQALFRRETRHSAK